jgi:predicted Zn-dependent protease
MRRSLLAALLICTAALAAACFARDPDTGRRQLLIYDEPEMNRMGDEAYRELLAKEQLSTDAEAVAMLKRVGGRIAAVARANSFQWEFALIESKTINAFCLPGGKVAFYTGILPLCRDEAGIATVMGHEVEHAIRQHGNERMSQGVLVGGAMQGLAAVLEARGTTPTTQNLFLAAVGAGTQVGMLKFSRDHELEADRMGLVLMAKAGYDPRHAVEFWQRFAQLDDGGTPGWLSTHPKSADRAQALHAQLPGAIQLYEAAPVRHGAGALVPARYRK